MRADFITGLSLSVILYPDSLIGKSERGAARPYLEDVWGGSGLDSSEVRGNTGEANVRALF